MTHYCEIFWRIGRLLQFYLNGAHIRRTDDDAISFFFMDQLITNVNFKLRKSPR